MIKVVHVDLLNATEAEEHGKDNHPEDPEDLIILEGSAGAGHHIGVSTGSHPSALCVSGADSPSSLADGSRWSSGTGDRSEEVTSSSLGNSLDALNVVNSAGTHPTLCIPPCASHPVQVLRGEPRAIGAGAEGGRGQVLLDMFV